MAVSNLTRSLLRFSPSLYAEEFRVIKKADGDIGPWGWEGDEFLKENHEHMAAREWWCVRRHSLGSQKRS